MPQRQAHRTILICWGPLLALAGCASPGDDTSGSGERAPPRLSGLPSNVLLMVVDGRVERVEVIDTLVATEAGARVGDNEQRIRALYPGRVRTQPHKYTDGQYLIVPLGAGADSVFRFVFETEQEKVSRYRAGRLPAVEWVEGCS